MNKTSTYTKNKTKKEFLILGFENYFVNSLTSSSNYEEEVYKLTDTDNSVGVYNRLIERLQQGDSLPSAIICNLDFLMSDNYFLLENTRKHPKLRLIPFILFTNDQKNIDRKELLKRGVDDCYVEPVNWSMLKKRIEFLSRFKADMINHEELKEHSRSVIPLGKRIFDILFASAVILMLSPVFLTIILLIKLTSPGPIIYRSKRVGTGYQVFDFLKFRSMCVDADAKLKDLAHLNTYAKEGEADVGFIKLENDPRITKIGKIIRKTSLDELPQLFNVLRGEMSIVGNRPLPLYEAEKMTKDAWAARFLAPAGITGLWQVCKEGKDNLTVDQRVGLDIEYARNYSLALDLKIISQTLPAMIQKES